MSGAIIALLTVIAQIAGALGSTSQVVSIISLLERIIPVVIKEYQDVAPFVKNIIGALKGNATVTPDQLAQLDILDAQVDEEFEAAATAAEVEDKGE